MASGGGAGGAACTVGSAGDGVVCGGTQPANAKMAMPVAMLAESFIVLVAILVVMPVSISGKIKACFIRIGYGIFNLPFILTVTCCFTPIG